MFVEEFREAVLVDGDLGVVDSVDDGLVDVDVDYFVSQISETGGDSGTDVPATDDENLHLTGSFEISPHEGSG